MRWPFTFYQANLGGNTAGYSKMGVIVIRSDLRDNEAVYQHELVHVRQWLWISILGAPAYVWLHLLGFAQWENAALLSVLVHPVLYTVSALFRQWAEVSAYRAQVSYGASIESCATSLSRDYGLKISEYQALALLTK